MDRPCIDTERPRRNVGVLEVSAWTRRKADDVFPTRSPSPSERSEHVSTQTRSPIPTGRTAVTVNGTRATSSCARCTMAPVSFTAAGLSVARRIPATPLSRTWSARAASSGEVTRAMIRSERATRFSRGITFQSSASTMT